MDHEKQVMLKEIALQPEFVSENIDSMFSFMRDVLKDRTAGELSFAFLTGCGDSYYACLAARLYMMEATGKFVEAVEALEFSRYLVNFLPQNSVLFGVSNSGRVARTIEAVHLARERGAWTIGLTVSRDNTLARTAETLLLVNSPPNIKEAPDGSRVVTPGTITYTASMLGLFVASIAFGEKLGTLGRADVDERLAHLHLVAQQMKIAGVSVHEMCRQLAPTMTEQRKCVIVGGGPNYATAHFGVAKWFEALQHAAQFSQLEEWAHEQYFITDSETDMIVLAPPGPGRERALEQIDAGRAMGARTIAIGAANDEAAKAKADVYLPMPPDVHEHLTPFVYKAPFEYLSCYIGAHRGNSFLGFNDRNRQAVNFRQIFESAQIGSEKARIS